MQLQTHGSPPRMHVRGSAADSGPASQQYNAGTAWGSGGGGSPIATGHTGGRGGETIACDDGGGGGGLGGSSGTATPQRHEHPQSRFVAGPVSVCVLVPVHAAVAYKYCASFVIALCVATKVPEHVWYSGQVGDGDYYI